MHVEHPLGLPVRGTLAHLAPSLTPLALAAARPDLTRSLSRSRSNSARPAMMVRINLALEPEIEAEPRLSQDANFPAVQIVERLNEVLRASVPSAEFGNKDSVDLAASSQRQSLGRLGRALSAPTILFPARLANDASRFTTSSPLGIRRTAHAPSRSFESARENRRPGSCVPISKDQSRRAEMEPCYVSAVSQLPWP
jgi:hypothetical protein